MYQEITTACIFPGQGAQYTGMGRDIYEQYPEAREVFDKADEILGFSISSLCFEGPEKALKLTENTQPAVLTTSIAMLRVLEARTDLRPDYLAGHSLGEYSALVCAGALSFEDAVLAVHMRGKFMQEAVPVGTGTMTAVMKIKEARLRELCGEVSREGHIVVCANINCPGQYVLSGHTAAVREVADLAKGEGAMVIPLAVSAPFHSPLMKKAADALADWLDRITFSDLEIPLINNADAKFIHTGADAKDSLIRQMQAPVRWEESVRKLIGKGTGRFVEIGPGKVLSGLMKRIDRSVKTVNVSDPASIEKFMESAE